MVQFGMPVSGWPSATQSFVRVVRAERLRALCLRDNDLREADALTDVLPSILLICSFEFL